MMIHLHNEALKQTYFSVIIIFNRARETQITRKKIKIKKIKKK